jgi:endonuclease-3
MTPKEKAGRLLDLLEKNFKAGFPDSDPFRVLIFCLLSQRTRDANTERAGKTLFAHASTPKDMLEIPDNELEQLIRPSGFYRQKTVRLKQICRLLLDDFNGEVPNTREELLRLPGIGYKCADIVLMYGHGVPSIAIDTHCNRIPKRIGIVDTEANLEEVKRVLESLIPKDRWYIINHGIVQFGQTVCRPINPRCNECSLNDVCDYYENLRRVRDQKKGDRSKTA